MSFEIGLNAVDAACLISNGRACIFWLSLKLNFLDAVGVPVKLRSLFKVSL